MSDWREATIAELCSRTTSGGTPSRKVPEYFCDPPDGIPWVRSQELIDRRIDRCGEHITEAGLKGSSAKLVPRDSILVAMYGATVGQLGYLDIEAATNQAICVLITNPEVTDPRYLYYALMQDRSRLIESAHGAAQQNLSQASIRGFSLRVPEVDEQRRIAGVLTAIDDLIENNRRRVEVLEEMARVIYREWFVHFRYPGHENVALVDSPLGPIPDGWAAVTIGDVLKLRYGKALKKGDRRGGPVAVVSSAGVVGWHDQTLVEGPTIVVGRKGNVGSVTWVDGDAWPIDTAYFVATELPLRYVAEQLRGTEFHNTHAAVPGLSREQAYSRPFLRPIFDMMTRFDETTGSLSTEARALTQASERLADVRDLLLPRLVTGQIDLARLDLDELTGVAS